jgi:hypothetical protein
VLLIKVRDKKCTTSLFFLAASANSLFILTGIIIIFCEGDCKDTIALHCRLYFREDSLGCLEYLDLIIGGNCKFLGLTDGEREAFTRGVVEGRDGKGIIFVFAAGNSLSTGDDTNLGSSTKNTRMVITVAAVGKSGTISFYSTPGATVFVSAPGKAYYLKSKQCICIFLTFLAQLL